MFRDPSLPRRILAIGGAVAVMLLLVIFVLPFLGGGTHAVADGPAGPESALRPIAAEADPYRLRSSMLGVDLHAPPRPDARTRTLAGYRALRAYPGAPPSVPHPLFGSEFERPTCNACHARGGYVSELNAYAPVTPHPEYGQCLQCHVPAREGEDRFRETDWRGAQWPSPGGSALPGSPTWIPHDLQLRGNCLACHGGPWSIPELRTSHPERMDCRSCHVPAPIRDDEAFTRPLDGWGGGGEGP